MRIQHNIAALNAKRNLSNNNNTVSKNLEKLSSGYKINRAGDDAAGLAISESMRAQIKGLNVAQKNANDGISMIQTAEGALTEVHSMLNRMYELAEQSANGVYTDDQRDRLSEEMTQLKDEIDRIGKDTNFNGKRVLDGDLQSTKLAIGDIGTGKQPGLELQIATNISQSDLGINNASIGKASDASAAAKTISTAITTVSKIRSKLGAYQNRLEHTINNLSVTEENVTAAESRIRDVDMAEEMMSYTKNNILVQAAQSMLAQANQVPQGVLQLLQ